MPVKIYCHRCKDFTWTDRRGCQTCRGHGTPWKVWLIMIVPIISFTYAVIRVWKGGGW